MTLKGLLDVASAPRLRSEVEAFLSSARPPMLDIDASGLAFADQSGMAVLYDLTRVAPAPGVRARIVALRPELEQLLSNFPEEPPRAVERAAPARLAVRAPEAVGAGALAALDEARSRVEFVGSVVLAFRDAVALRRIRCAEVARVFMRAGVNALPIVLLVSFLTGLVIALESADPFSRYGAQLLIADTIGLAMTRELGPLMTAVVLSGRSGSAFAAELGTMKVNEELDALATMGLDPVRFLVIQRVLAGTLLTPLLTIYAMACGIVGGAVVMRGLGFSNHAVWDELVSAVGVSDLLFGLAKGVVFGAAIAAVGCHRGMRVVQGPSAVGDAATRAVVSSLVLVTLIDTVFAILMNLLRR